MAFTSVVRDLFLTDATCFHCCGSTLLSCGSRSGVYFCADQDPFIFFIFHWLYYFDGLPEKITVFTTSSLRYGTTTERRLFSKRLFFKRPFTKRPFTKCVTKFPFTNVHLQNKGTEPRNISRAILSSPSSLFTGVSTAVICPAAPEAPYKRVIKLVIKINWQWRSKLKNSKH